jgi:hypothetical protein
MAAIWRAGWWLVGDRLLVMTLFLTAGTMIACAAAVSPLWLSH